MQRVILVPAILVPDALDELKNWLSITTVQDDASLTALLRAALDTCEAFTRQMPLEAACEEIHASSKSWQFLSTNPVQSITGLESVDTGGSRTPLASTDFEIELEADGCGRFRLLQTSVPGRIAVQFAAGLAPDWNALPDGLRHGIIRLAAHNYRQRDLDQAKLAPPAAVAALWSPWRRLRLQ